MLKAVSYEGETIKAVCDCGQLFDIPAKSDIDGLIPCEVTCACGRSHVSCMTRSVQGVSNEQLETRERLTIIRELEGDILLKAEARARGVGVLKAFLIISLLCSIGLALHGCVQIVTTYGGDAYFFLGAGLTLALFYALTKLEGLFDLEPSRAQVLTLYKRRLGVALYNVKTTYITGFRTIDEDMSSRNLESLKKPTPIFLWRGKDGNLEMVYDPTPHINTPERYKLYQNLVPFSIPYQDVLLFGYYGEIRAELRHETFNMLGGLVGGFLAGDLGVALGGGLFDMKMELVDDRYVIIIYRRKAGDIGAIAVTRDAYTALSGWYPEKRIDDLQKAIN